MMIIIDRQLIGNMRKRKPSDKAEDKRQPEEDEDEEEDEEDFEKAMLSVPVTGRNRN